MTSLIKDSSQFQLNSNNIELILNKIALKLRGRVEAAYIFGSASTKELSSNSDIDLILVVKETKTLFVQRAFEFSDLFEIYPDLDILVYTQPELEQHLNTANLGFWKSVKTSLKQLI